MRLAITTLSLLFATVTASDVCTDECFTGLEGDVDDCCKNFDSVDELNKKLHPVLEDLRRRPFFNFYKTNVFKTCPFWAESGQCDRESCAMRECVNDELPGAFQPDMYYDDSPQCCEKWVDHIVQKLPEGARYTIANLIEHEEERMFWDVGDKDEYNVEGEILQPTWYNLMENPERFTGYIGDSAAKVWRLIYEENCFHPEDTTSKNVFELLKYENIASMCVEKRIFYRLISGMHTSITVHVASEYFDESTQSWAPNTEMFYKKFSPEYTYGEGPRRLRNLYFVYLFILRAIEKAEPYWKDFEFYSGDAVLDNQTRELAMQVVDYAHTAHAFDETVMFGGEAFEMDNLKQEFRDKFHNVSRIMDCVECAKCRMWGKLQIEGLATAIKILFTNTYNSDDLEPATCPAEHKGSSSAFSKNLKLRRNEVVSLFQTLEHFSYSINQLEGLRNIYIPDPKNKEQSKAPPTDNKPPFAFAGTRGGI